MPQTLRSADSRALSEERAAGGPSFGSMRVMIEIASMKPSTVRMPGTMPARNNAEMLVSVNRP